MLKATVSVTVFAILLSVLTGYVESSEIRLISPIGAAARSVIPGWGQVYTRSKLQGAIVFLSVGLLAGGGVRAGYPDFSLRTASLRCDEANAVEADFLLTECPFCWRNLYDANELYNHGMTVMGILQMISEYNLLDIVSQPTEEDFLFTEEALIE